MIQETHDRKFYGREYESLQELYDFIVKGKLLKIDLRGKHEWTNYSRSHGKLVRKNLGPMESSLSFNLPLTF
jgi:hypothetical protein